MDLDGREHALYAAYLSAAAFASAGSGLHHKICHVLGGKYNLPHAQTHATVLPYVLAFNGPAAPDAERRIAAAFGSADRARRAGRAQAGTERAARPRATTASPRTRSPRRPTRSCRRSRLQPAPGHRRGPPRAAARRLVRRRPAGRAGGKMTPEELANLAHLRRARDLMDREYAQPARRRRARPGRADVARPFLPAVPRRLRRDAVRLPDDPADRAGQGAAAPAATCR